MALTADIDLLQAVPGRVDTREHACLDRQLDRQLADLSLREAKARAASQETLSLALTAQYALLVRLRQLCRRRYWSLLNGTAAKVE